MVCQFCWQLPPTLYQCKESTKCKTVRCPREYFISNCTALEHVHCLGNRTFQKKMYCNWTGGYKWSTALALSITLGGFGADRFYLGQWKEGLGKLFSFGGLGIWTLIDVLLIGIGYVGPADGSLYIWAAQGPVLWYHLELRSTSSNILENAPSVQKSLSLPLSSWELVPGWVVLHHCFLVNLGDGDYWDYQWRHPWDLTVTFFKFSVILLLMELFHMQHLDIFADRSET